ncbi:MAG: hypothetical protein ACR2IS_06495 [Nitrososphaeraceae archaeon]
MSTSAAKSRFQYKDISDFLLGFEYGQISGLGMWYYRNQVEKRRSGATGEEAKQVGDDIDSIIFNRLPEIRQAILRIF